MAEEILHKFPKGVPTKSAQVKNFNAERGFGFLRSEGMEKDGGTLDGFSAVENWKISVIHLESAMIMEIHTPMQCQSQLYDLKRYPKANCKIVPLPRTWFLWGNTAKIPSRICRFHC